MCAFLDSRGKIQWLEWAGEFMPQTREQAERRAVGEAEEARRVEEEKRQLEEEERREAADRVEAERVEARKQRRKERQATALASFEAEAMGLKEYMATFEESGDDEREDDGRRVREKTGDDGTEADKEGKDSGKGKEKERPKPVPRRGPYAPRRAQGGNRASTPLLVPSESDEGEVEVMVIGKKRERSPTSKGSVGEGKTVSMQISMLADD